MIEEPVSAIWTRRFNKPGDFEIHTPATPELFELLLPGRCIAHQSGDAITITPIESVRYITRQGNSEVMVVERLELTTDEENGDFLTISGRSGLSLLDRRVIWGQILLSGSPDWVIYSLVYRNAINPDDPNRKLPLRMVLSGDTASDPVRVQYTGGGLLETAQALCVTYDYGMRIVNDGDTAVDMRIELYYGTDRRAGQTENSPVIFSSEFENLLSSHYAFDVAKYKNVALVAGEGEGQDRKRATYGEASGLARRELYVDARDLSTNEGDISDDDYTAQLEERGAERLSETQIAEAFGGEITTDNTFVLDEDYTVGDIVTVENDYGIRADARIIAVSEYWDANGYSTDCVFEGLEG